MSEPAIARRAHRQVLALLPGLERKFLTAARCWFGGGTRLVLALGEYRESRDVNLLCSDREGYRLLRETVQATSLGRVCAGTISLAREVRADQYGIRTFVEVGETRIKFEIVREARIDIEGEDVAGIPVPCLSRRHCFAEKFLANTDRGLDDSTLSRDIIDLAFMMQGWSRKDADAGMAIAETAYGTAVQRSLVAAVERLRRDKAYRNRCVEGLAIADTGTLSAGLKALSDMSSQ